MRASAVAFETAPDPLSTIASAHRDGAATVATMTTVPAAGPTLLESLAGQRPATRPKVRAVTVSVDCGRYRVQVEMERNGDRAVGLADGPLIASAGRRLVAEATLQALTLLGTGADRGAVDSVVVTPLGGQLVALVSVVMDAGTHEENHVGSALVRNTGEHDAVARAVLDATNRRLSTRD